jgi:coenzyme F420-reducing hydrogenase gamma subunit
MTPTEQKKLRIGWFTFSCCEDSTIIFTELLNDHWQEWKRLLDIRHARVLQTNNVLDELDVAFIEGALSSQDHVDKVKEIRSKSKKVVAIGACAVTGLPSAQRNQFDDARLQEIKPILEKFDYLPKAQKLSEVITVDMNVPGCPMSEKTFLEALTALLKEFNIS